MHTRTEKSHSKATESNLKLNSSCAIKETTSAQPSSTTMTVRLSDVRFLASATLAYIKFSRFEFVI